MNGNPSSGATRPLLPHGEKEGNEPAVVPVAQSSTVSPSPLAGEGARRADEGVFRHAPILGSFARRMRREPTDAEARLWSLLRARRFAGFKFRRQVPVGSYIADFVCYSARLIIELDGSQHADCARDETRDAYLRGQGFRILRIWNSTLLTEPDTAAQSIWHSLNEEYQS